MGELIDGDTNVTLLLFKLLGQHRETPENFPSNSVPLSDLTRRDLHTMAGGMLVALRLKDDEKDATDWFIEQYPAMSELADAYPEFREAIITITKRIVSEVRRMGRKGRGDGRLMSQVTNYTLCTCT